MKKINYAENRNVYMPTFRMKKVLLEATRNIYEYPDYKNVIVNQMVSNYFSTNIKNISVTNGSLDGINLLLRCVKKKKATLFEPTFWGYKDALNRHNYQVTSYNLEHNIDYNWDKLNTASKKSEVIIICNPNNPTLSTLTKQQIIDLVKENKQCHFIIDETMLIFDKDFYRKTLISEVDKYDNLSLVISFSKFFGIAGLRIGCVFSNSKIIQQINNAQVPYSLGIVQQKLLPFALNEKKYLEKTKVLIEKNRNYLCQEFERLGLNVIKGNTNFVLIELPNDIDADYVTDLLLKDNLVVRNIKKSYPLLEGNWLRVSIQTKKNNKLLVKKLKKILTNM